MRTILCALLITAILFLNMPAVYGWTGNNGFEAGISSGSVYDTKNITENYSEIVFISGKPVLFSGSLIVTKKSDEQKITTTYSYRNLKNVSEDAAITRGNVVVETYISKKDNGQITESSKLVNRPTETVKIDDTTYTLTGYSFSRAGVTDSKPCVNYCSGVFSGVKTYTVRAGTTGIAGASRTDAKTVSVEFTGRFTGHDQYWGMCEAVKTDYLIKCSSKTNDEDDLWGGAATVSTTSTMAKDLKYIPNEPYSISFDGSYIQTKSNSGVLEYKCSLPEFNAKGIATDYKIEYSDSIRLEMPLDYEGLPTYNLQQIRGHWSEKDVRALYSLEILDEDSTQFQPEKYMNRGEFIRCIVKAAPEVPIDSALLTKMTKAAGRTGKQQQEEAIFYDVLPESRYYEAVRNAYNRKIISGVGDNMFAPESQITVADAITIFIRAIGLDKIAPNPIAVPSFRDNDEIPAWARNAVYVARNIGLVNGDEKGYIKPNSPLTNSRAAAMLNRFVNYLRNDISRDYERIIEY